jgi:hypothetical protein
MRGVKTLEIEILLLFLEEMETDLAQWHIVEGITSCFNAIKDKKKRSFICDKCRQYFLLIAFAIVVFVRTESGQRNQL